jgi:hypothetical protein
MSTNWTWRNPVNSSWQDRPWVVYLATELLDFLMTEDNDYLITNDSIYNTWVGRPII